MPKIQEPETGPVRNNPWGTLFRRTRALILRSEIKIPNP